MLDKLRAVFKTKTNEFEIKSYDRPQVSFSCPHKLKMEVTHGVARLPDGTTHKMTVVVWTYLEDQDLYWGELVTKALEEELHQHWPPAPKPSKY